MNLRIPALLLICLFLFSACSNKINLTGVKTVLVNPSRIERVGTFPNYLNNIPGPELGERFTIQYEQKLRDLGAEVIRFPDSNAVPTGLDSGLVFIYISRLQIKEEVDTSRVGTDEMADGSVFQADYYSYSATSDITIRKIGSNASPQKVTTTSDADPEPQKRPLLKRIFGPKEPELEKIEGINEQIFLELAEINARLASRRSAKTIKKIFRSK